MGQIEGPKTNIIKLKSVYNSKFPGDFFFYFFDNVFGII